MVNHNSLRKPISLKANDLQTFHQLSAVFGASTTTDDDLRVEEFKRRMLEKSITVALKVEKQTKMTTKVEFKKTATSSKVVTPVKEFNFRAEAFPSLAETQLKVRGSHNVDFRVPKPVEVIEAVKRITVEEQTASAWKAANAVEILKSTLIDPKELFRQRVQTAAFRAQQEKATTSSSPSLTEPVELQKKHASKAVIKTNANGSDVAHRRELFKQQVQAAALRRQKPVAHVSVKMPQSATSLDVKDVGEEFKQRLTSHLRRLSSEKEKSASTSPPTPMHDEFQIKIPRQRPEVIYIENETDLITLFVPCIQPHNLPCGTKEKPEIFMDCEGFRLGRNGTLGCIEVLIRTQNVIFHLDINNLGFKAFDTFGESDAGEIGIRFRDVLQSGVWHIVWWDIRQDQDVLWHHFKISFDNTWVTDMCLMELVVRYGERSHRASLANCIRGYGKAWMTKTEMREFSQINLSAKLYFQGNEDGYKVFNQSPLPEIALTYAVEDMMHFSELYEELQKLVRTSEEWDLIASETQKAVLEAMREDFVSSGSKAPDIIAALPPTPYPEGAVTAPLNNEGTQEESTLYKIAII